MTAITFDVNLDFRYLNVHQIAGTHEPMMKQGHGSGQSFVRKVGQIFKGRYQKPYLGFSGVAAVGWMLLKYAYSASSFRIIRSRSQNFVSL